MPPITPWKKNSRGSNEGVSDRQKNSAPTATPTKSSRTSPQAHSRNGCRSLRSSGSAAAAPVPLSVSTLALAEAITRLPEQLRQHALERGPQFVERRGENSPNLDCGAVPV